MMAAMLKMGAPAPAPAPVAANTGGSAGNDSEGGGFAAELDAQTQTAQTEAAAAPADHGAAGDGAADERNDGSEQPPADSALSDILAALALLPGSPFAAPAAPATQPAQAAAGALQAVAAAVDGKALAPATLQMPALPAALGAAATPAAAAPVDAAALPPAQGIPLAGFVLPAATAPDGGVVAELAVLRTDADGAALDMLGGNGAGDSAGEGGLEFRLPEAAPAARSAGARATPLELPLNLAQQRDGEFAEGVASRMQWMTEQKIGRAELRLNPADLGSIDVTLQLEGKQVRAEFTSASAEVRQLLENGIPKLREMFSSQGLQLAHSHVGQQDSQAQQQASERSGGDASGSDAIDGTTEIGDAPVRIRAPLGLVDAFA